MKHRRRKRRKHNGFEHTRSIQISRAERIAPSERPRDCTLNKNTLNPAYKICIQGVLLWGHTSRMLYARFFVCKPAHTDISLHTKSFLSPGCEGISLIPTMKLFPTHLPMMGYHFPLALGILWAVRQIIILLRSFKLVQKKRKF
jgi:hypothetical protein